MGKLSKDMSAGALHPRETLFVSGALGSLNAEVIVAADGASSVALDLRGTFVGTFEVAGTIDGVNWTPIPIRQLNAANVSFLSGATAVGAYVGRAAPFRQVRVRCTAYTSGAATTVLVADTAILDDTMQDRSAPLLVTSTGAAAAAVTLTLPSPGAGLRQYLSKLRISRFATGLLTAGTAPVIATTTNLPGALALNFPADAAAQGALTVLSEDFTLPLPASAQATAVTIVCPATTGVIWRITATYFVAP